MSEPRSEAALEISFPQVSGYWALPLLTQRLEGIANYVGLQMMALLDLNTAFRGDMRGRAGHEFMSLFQVAVGSQSHNARVVRISASPLKVDLHLQTGLLPAGAVADRLTTTYDTLQKAPRPTTGSRPDPAVARALLVDPIVTAHGAPPPPLSPEGHKFVTVVDSAATSLFWLDSVRRTDA